MATKTAKTKKTAEKKATTKKAACKTKAAPKKATAKKAAIAAKPMTKAQVVSYFAEKFELTKDKTSNILDELVALSATEAKRAGAFTIPGLGKVTLQDRKARMGRNPATGEAMKIPAKTVVKMRLSKSFAEAVVPPKKKAKK